MDWPIWSEKFLAKARRSGYKSILLGKTIVPKDDEDITKNADGTTASADDVKKKQNLRDLNEEAYEELLLSIDHKQEQGRIAFTLITGSKDKDYADGNAREAWKRLDGIRSLFCSSIVDRIFS